jgi:hypothetical protein
MTDKTKLRTPSEINTSDGFFDSIWKNAEKEVIARNLVLIAKKVNPDIWTDFTWDSYQEICNHTVSECEKEVIDSLVAGGYLTKKRDTYSFERKFLIAVDEFGE